jgi:hypothetical protein
VLKHDAVSLRTCHHVTKKTPRSPCSEPHTTSGVTLNLRDGRMSAMPVIAGAGTHDSAVAPKVCGMKRGLWIRIVEAMVWYRHRQIEKARLPGRKS